MAEPRGLRPGDPAGARARPGPGEEGSPVGRAEVGPAFYALRSGGWRDYWSLLHPPYTLWHLSYVAIGASVASAFDVRHLLATLVAFFLGVGVTAHALDELNGRPLRTRIPAWALRAMASAALAGAIGIGAAGAARVSWWLLAFVAFGGFIVVAYNLELLGGRLHSDAWFALAWGAFPALTAGFAQTGTLEPAVVLVAGAAAALSAAQRALSTPVRMLRRHARHAEGSVLLRDGTEIPLDAAALRAVPERALRWLSAAMPLLAAGLVALRIS